MNKKVLIGLSGGVDSAASVILLQKKGYDVTALYFDVKKSGDDEAFARAESAAEKLNIGLIRKNVSAEFESHIISYFCSEYEKGRTPSPCVMCNPLVKLRVLADEADKLGIYHIATGHYASVFTDKDGICYPAKSVETKKDQSYMLCRVPQDILKRIIFPLEAEDDKENVRALAESFSLENAHRHDSQDLCFFEGDYRDFLAERGVTGKAGTIRLSDGTFLKDHAGIAGFTLGQRKGLGVAAGRPVFVTSIDPETGTVTMGSNEELFKRNVLISDLFFEKYGASSAVPAEYCGRSFTAKLRYTAKEAVCTIISDTDGRAVLVFDEPQRAPTPGQFAVLYDKNIVIGSGIIV